MNNINQEEEIYCELKVTFVGDAGVGKTSIIDQLINHKFSQEVPSTIGGGNFIKLLTVENKKCQLSIWDTAGQERFRSLSKIYLKNSNIVIYVYDITKKESFENISKNWIPIIHELLGDKNIVFGIFGNKSDLYSLDNVGIDNGKNLADEINALFFETTALNYDNVIVGIRELVSKYIIEYKPLIDKKKNNILLKDEKVKKDGCCGKKK